ncbi:MAG: hypothetical protein WB810_14540 [Candidatus Cybelea sp.]
MLLRLSTLAAVVVALSALPIVAGAYTTIGELVYNFTYSANQNITSRDSSDNAEAYGSASTKGGVGTQITGGSNGMSHYGGTLTDKGTITVDILKKQPDGAMVVMIGEQGQNVRRAPPAECVVYGNTHVICDPNKTVYTEEYTLLRFLGANFVDPSQLDSSKHWQVVQNNGDGSDINADYSINSNNNGVMQIGEKRKVRLEGAGHLTTNIETSIGYDYSRLVPTSVDEYATQRTDAGIKGNSTTTYQTTLNLVTDTMAKT